jgi:hypothetical protein
LIQSHDTANAETFLPVITCCCLPQPRQIAFVKALTAKQHELGLYGAVGEIGVHHGKFLIPIIGNALAGEPAVALDLFEDQTGNVDTSGASARDW